MFHKQVYTCVCVCGEGAGGGVRRVVTVLLSSLVMMFSTARKSNRMSHCKALSMKTLGG